MSVDGRVVRVLVNRRPYNWTEPQRQNAVRVVAGSGFFISPITLVTNAHVVHEAQPMQGVWVTSARILTPMPARIVGFVPFKDLAVLSVRGDGTRAHFSLGDSDRVRVGTPVTAMGYQLGSQELDVTQGTISGFEHPDNQMAQAGEAVGFSGRSMIQVDASINPGSSGGPLVDRESGEVVGIITSGIPDTNALGYATPVRHLHAVLRDVLTGPSPLLRVPHLGFRWQASNEAMDLYAGRPVTTEGVRVVQVFRHSFAERMGMRPDDTLLSWLGTRLGERGLSLMEGSGRIYTINDMFDTLMPGTRMEASVWRQDHGVVHLDPVVYQHGVQPVFPVRFMYPQFESVQFLVVRGLTIMQFALNHISGRNRLNGTLALYQQAQNQQVGALIIAYVEPGKQAHQHGVLRAGQLIASINGVVVMDFNVAAQLVGAAQRTLLTVETRDGIKDTLAPV